MSLLVKSVAAQNLNIYKDKNLKIPKITQNKHRYLNLTKPGTQDDPRYWTLPAVWRPVFDSLHKIW